MSLPKSPNPIDFNTIINYFTGGTGPFQYPYTRLGDYYRGGNWVYSNQYGWLNGGPPGNPVIIPSSGPISFGNFYGVERTIKTAVSGPLDSQGSSYMLAGDRTWYVRILAVGGGGGGSCVPYWGGLVAGTGGSGGITYAEYTISSNGNPTYITLHPGGGGGAGQTQTYNACVDFRGAGGINGFSGIYCGGFGGGAGYSHTYYDQNYADGGAGGGGAASVVTAYNPVYGSSEVLMIAPGGGGGTYRNSGDTIWVEPRTIGNMRGTVRYSSYSTFGWVGWTISRATYYAYICYGNPVADVYTGEPTFSPTAGQNGYDSINYYNPVAIRQAPTAVVPCGAIVGYSSFTDISVYGFGYVRDAGGCGGGGAPNGLSGLFSQSPGSRGGNSAGYGAAGSAGNLYIRSSFATGNITRTAAQYTLPPENTRVQTSDGRVTTYGRGGLVGSNGSAGAISILIADNPSADTVLPL